jgi:hypothetical protein
MVTANLNLWIEPDSGLFASQWCREGSFPLLPQGIPTYLAPARSNSFTR